MDTENTMEQAKFRLLEAALPHVPFDGWSEATFMAAVTDSATPVGLARALFPRAGIDLAVAYHQQGDAAMQQRLAATDLAALRIRERITLAVRTRLESADRELVRKGSALLALPQYIGEGPKLIWQTADAIWNALGDTSRDVNWYTKRATLAAVYASTLLFWLGDTSENDAQSWEFLDRRIADVMQFEKAKAGIRSNPLGKAILEGPLKILERVHAPLKPDDLPGQTRN